MKFKLLVILIMLCGLTCFAQKSDEKAKLAARQIILKKQILVDELNNQAKDVPLAAVRVFARMKLAEWLWRDGKDETGRAEPIAVKAVEELYEKKNEIPTWFFLSSDLFGLLELNAKDATKRLRAKYNIEESEDLRNASSLLNKEGGDKIVGAKIKRALSSENDLNSFAYMISELRDRKSPEFLSILFEIVNLEESGRNSFAPGSLSWVVDDYRDATVPNSLQIRFYRIVIGKARSAIQAPDTNGVASADALLYAILPDISANAPELSAEAMALKAVLSAKTSQGTRERQERDKRIDESADKLDALISEAEKTESKSEKNSLYDDAGKLATKLDKFQLAVDLYDNALENLVDGNTARNDLFNGYHDQQLNEIVKAALAKNDVESAEYATKKILGALAKAEALRSTAIYFYENKDSASALSAYDEALKLVMKTDSTKPKFYMLFRLIPAAQTIDSDRVSEVTAITAKTIDNFPTLNPEDKPGTENFNKYVATIMVINVNVNSVMSDLVKKNKSEANDFAIRINRKEFKIIADLVLAINRIDIEKKRSNLK
ncbi:MAG: hypothetical protein WKF90_07245 [Pyrinomonadaceae bacterium]